MKQFILRNLSTIVLVVFLLAVLATMFLSLRYDTKQLSEREPIHDTVCPDTALADYYLMPAIVPALWQAICTVESDLNPRAYNPKSGAKGIGQITDIMVMHINFIQTEYYFRPQDCYSPGLSYLMFTLLIRYDNLMSIDEVITRWNPNCSAHYRQLVKSIFADIITEGVPLIVE